MALPRTTELPGVLFLAAFFLAGCFAEQPEKKPTLDVAGPLSFIVVYAGNVAFGQSGTGADGITLAIGGSATLSAQGRDANNRPIRISPSWTVNRPELVQLTPGVTADTAILTGLRAGKVEVAAQYAGVRKTVNYVFVK